MKKENLEEEILAKIQDELPVRLGIWLKRVRLFQSSMNS